MEKVLRSVVVGTTGVCNASCVHCPTNKPETAHLLRRPMDLSLFESLVDQLSAGRFAVRSFFSFGLFGDALLDPFVVERAEILHAKLPSVPFSINTNAAAYRPAAHAALVDYVKALVIHIESLRPEVYDVIMRPLRLEHVLPKIDMILQDFGRKATVGVPLHRANIGDRKAIAEYFLERGAGEIHFSALSNRCSQDPCFDLLALAPQGPPCRGDIVQNLIVDWDGKVLMCCNDFQKKVPVGDLTDSSVEEILENQQRASFAAKLDAGEWPSIATCSKCKWDKVEPALLGLYTKQD